VPALQHIVCRYTRLPQGNTQWQNEMNGRDSEYGLVTEHCEHIKKCLSSIMVNRSNHLQQFLWQESINFTCRLLYCPLSAAAHSGCGCLHCLLWLQTKLRSVHHNRSYISGSYKTKYNIITSSMWSLKFKHIAQGHQFIWGHTAEWRPEYWWPLFQSASNGVHAF
jgi:hypothetical protein